MICVVICVLYLYNIHICHTDTHTYYISTNVCVYIYIYTHICRWSHAGIYPAVIVDFVCFSWVIFVNPSMILRFSIIVHCDLAWVLGPRTSFCIGIYSISCIWPHVRASTAEVVSFLWSLKGRQSMIAANSLVRFALFGKLLRQTNPQTYNISLGPRPPPGFSLTCKDCGKAFSNLCHQQSMHCVPVTTKPGSSWRLLFSQTHVCWTMVNHYQPLWTMVNHYQPLVTTRKRYS